MVPIHIKQKDNPEFSGCKAFLVCWIKFSPSSSLSWTILLIITIRCLSMIFTKLSMDWVSWATNLLICQIRDHQIDVHRCTFNQPHWLAFINRNFSWEQPRIYSFLSSQILPRSYLTGLEVEINTIGGFYSRARACGNKSQLINVSILNKSGKVYL